MPQGVATLVYDGDCGFFGSCDWDWELDVEAWGCAAPKGQTPMTM